MGPVVALGQEEFGEKAEVGHLLAAGCEFWNLGSDGRQPQHPA